MDPKSTFYDEGFLLAQDEFPGGFDAIIGADVVYAAEHVPSLFAAAAALLAPDGPDESSTALQRASWSPKRPPLVMLCYTARR